MKKCRLGIILLISAVTCLNACIDLKHVNGFSASAIETLQTYPAIRYTFTSSYKDYTMGKRLFIFSEIEFKNNKFGTDELKVDSASLQLSNDADATISYFATTLAAYFEGLSKISGKEFVNYNFDDLATNFKSLGGAKSKLKITDEQIDAGASIAKTFADEIAGKYREKKLREILITKDAALSNAVNALTQALKILDLNTVNDMSLVSGNFQRLFADTTLDRAQKLNWKFKHNEMIADLRNESSKIRFLIAGVTNIKAGHNAIVNEVKTKKLDASEVIALLDEYTTKTFGVIEQIKLLHNQ